MSASVRRELSRYSTLNMIERFIGFDTTSRDGNLPLIDFVASYLRQFEIPCEIIPDPTGRKANLLAKIGSGNGPGIILSGHTDTVPVDDQAWTSDPFKLTRRGDLLYGRGTTDMKGFVAICAALAPEFAALPLREPIYLAMSYDEELGCLGVPSMIDRIRQLPQLPRACIVGEPSEMEVFIAHKGVNVFETTITGREAHSSQTNSGASSIVAAAELIAFLNRIGLEMRERGDPTGVFEQDGFTSFNVGLIQGGTALNIIPKTCKFQWEYRHIPGTPAMEIIDRFRAYAAEVVLPQLRRTAPEASIATRTVVHYGGLKPSRGSFAEQIALECAGKPKAGTTAFGTEAGLFQEAGIPTVVCGPGSIAQAHRPDEFIAVEQVEACTSFLRKLVQILV